MSESNKKNMGQSVFDRLKALAKERKDDLNIILERYIIERLLYRLSISSYRNRFILKGGSLLIALQDGVIYRVTRDADLLGFGESDIQHIEEVFREIIQLAVEDDGVVFLPETLQLENIKEEHEYAGTRIRIIAKIHNARQPIQIDIGFGDAVTPHPQEMNYPTLLSDMPSANLRMYPLYTVIAEKFEAMVKLGIKNSRMKDFYDIWILKQLFEFDGNLLQEALLNTFERRKTAFPNGIPFIFTDEFYLDDSKYRQWDAFVRKSHPNLMERELTFKTLIEELIPFLKPIIEAIQLEQTFNLHWIPDKGWYPSPEDTTKTDNTEVESEQET